ncbi:MAG: hypothetical protein ACXACP_03230 [Candidatus Hodarchaeales archaeon]|jgi:hypothetical protein
MSQRIITPEDRQLAQIGKEKRLQLALEYLNYSGVFYTRTVTPKPLVSTNDSSNRPAA